MNNKIRLILILLNFWINLNKNIIQYFRLIVRQKYSFSFGLQQILILWEYSPGPDRMACTTKKGRSPKAAPFLKTIITIQPRSCLRRIRYSSTFKQAQMNRCSAVCFILAVLCCRLNLSYCAGWPPRLRDCAALQKWPGTGRRPRQAQSKSR